MGLSRYTQLDTNVLIGLFAPNQQTRIDLRILATIGHEFSASAFAWHEFVSGPLQIAQKEYALAFLQERIYPVDKSMAELAAKFFNETGRRRGSRGDCFIAASAIISGATLLTYNRIDFEIFLPFGLTFLEQK